MRNAKNSQYQGSSRAERRAMGKSESGLILPQSTLNEMAQSKAVSNLKTSAPWSCWCGRKHFTETLMLDCVH